MTTLAALRQTTRATLCAECGKCTSVCPLAPWGCSPREIVAGLTAADADGGLRHCLTCGACEQRCPQGVRFGELMRGARRLLVRDAQGASCPHGGAPQAFMHVMARGEWPQKRLGWLQGLETHAEHGEVFYWTGCAAHYDAFFADLAPTTLDGPRAAVHLLNRLGIVPVVSPEERCCGHDLLWNGDREGFEALARHNVELLVRSGAETLVTSCAECLRTWRLDYAPLLPAAPPRRMHISELLAERLPELAFRGDVPRKVTFQDPCRLGRHLGVYDAPRMVLAALPGVELTEMARSAGRAQCCAGGTWLHCDGAARQLQVERLHEARATGAQVLVTACPKCRIHLRCAMRHAAPAQDVSIEVRDVAELVADALTPAPTDPVPSPGPTDPAPSPRLQGEAQGEGLPGAGPQGGPHAFPDC